MIKEKAIDYKDTNVANIGTDEDKALRYAAALSEEAFKKAGEKPGLEIWRVENRPQTDSKPAEFGVKRWPLAQFGSFYDGDSYIVMRTYQKENIPAFFYDIHFWLGRESSQDEKGVAAYKTVELDDLLHQKPVQHREIMGHESPLFLSYFPKGIKIMQGGIESGFSHVEPDKYTPRLLLVKGRKNARATQVSLQVSSLNDDDVFVLDLGLKIIQWNGKTSHPLERRKASEISADIRTDRNGKPTFAVVDSAPNDEEGEDGKLFWNAFGGKKPIAEKGKISDEEADKLAAQLKIFRLSNDSGKMTFAAVDVPNGKSAAEICKSSALNANDVQIVDCGTELYVWVGKGANKEERNLCMKYAENYLKSNGRPDYFPITRILDGNEPDSFNNLFAPSTSSSSSSSTATRETSATTTTAAAENGTRFLSSLFVTQIHTDVSGDFMSDTGEWFIEATGASWLGLQSGRFPSKSHFKLSKGDTINFGDVGELVIANILVASEKVTNFETTLKIMEEDPLKNDTMLTLPVSFPLSSGKQPISGKSADGKVTVSGYVTIQPLSSLVKKEDRLNTAGLTTENLTATDDATGAKFTSLKPSSSVSEPKYDFSKMTKKKTGHRALVSLRLFDIHVDESGEFFSDKGEFFVQCNGSRYPSHGEFKLTVGESVTVGGVVVYSAFLDEKTQAEQSNSHPIVFLVKEHDLIVDDTMLTCNLKADLKSPGVHYYRLVSKNGKTTATVSVSVVNQEIW